jgi:hypothetical protein
MLNKYPEHQAYLDYEAEKECRLREAQMCYSAIGSYFHWKVDAIYEDKIIDLVGERGLALIREFRLMEPCAVNYGRKLYAL